jgi:hypothetical protein
MTRLAPMLLLALAGCATANMDCTDLRQGACKLSFMRLATDTSANLTGPDGFSLSYSSNPQAEATAQAFAAINRLAGLVAAGRAPATPLVEDGDADGVGWAPTDPGFRSVPIRDDMGIPISEQYQGLIEPTLEPSRVMRSCPATQSPRRVTDAAPVMASGVARAAEL